MMNGELQKKTGIQHARKMLYNSVVVSIFFIFTRILEGNDPI